MKINHGQAITVGQLKAALAQIPDNVEVGHALDVSGYLSKVSSVAYDDKNGLLIMVVDSRGGSFAEDEVDSSWKPTTVCKAG